MAKRKEKQPDPLWTDNLCEEHRCGQCRYMTNVAAEKRRKSNVMGGCFLSGVIVFTNLESCREFEPFEDLVTE